MKTILLNPEHASFAPIPERLLPPVLDKARVAKIARYIPLVDGGVHEAPISFQVALLDACFNRCVMCDHPTRPQHMIHALEWLEFLEPLRNKVESVCYSGGDPMAHPEFNDVMLYHRFYGIKFGMTISGYVPPRIDMDLLKGADWVRVSLDAITPEVYAAVRGHTPIAKIVHGIDSMLEAGVNVELGITVHAGNRRDLDNVLAFADSRGIKNRFVHPIYPDSIGAEEPLAERNIQAFSRCSAVFYQLYVDTDGSVYPCCITAGDTRAEPQAVALGNIRDEWSETWKRVVAFSQRTKLPEICKNCVQRLSEINHVVEYTNTDKSFF